MSTEVGCRMNSPKSSRTSKRKNSGAAAEILDVFLNSPVGKQMSAAVVDMIGRVFSNPAQRHERLRQEAGEATRKYHEQRERHNPYQVFGIARDAPRDTVKAVYFHLQKQYHPDGRSPDLEKSKAVNQAYDEICQEKGWAK